MQRLDLDRERLGVAGVEAMQPLRELVAVQRMAHGPFHLRELVGGEQRAQLLVQLDDPLLRFLVLRREANQAADVGVAALLDGHGIGYKPLDARLQGRPVLAGVGLAHELQ